MYDLLGNTTPYTIPIDYDFWSVVSSIDDIRIHDMSFSQNYFWVEQYDPVNHICIIHCNIEAGQSNLIISYGNKYATTSLYHNPSKVFIYFTDFTSNATDWSLDTLGSTQIGYTYNGTSSWLSLSDADSSYHYASANINLNTSQLIEYKWAMPVATQPSAYIYFLQDSAFSQPNYGGHVGSENGGLPSNIETLYGNDTLYDSTSGDSLDHFPYAIDPTKCYTTYIYLGNSLDICFHPCFNGLSI